MATPPRLVEIECPRCGEAHWVIDHDYRTPFPNGQVDYPDRCYSCPQCSTTTTGWSVRAKSPPDFLLQPHDLYPMTRADFDYWVEILRANFPDHSALSRLDDDFYPRTPEDLERVQGSMNSVADQPDDRPTNTKKRRRDSVDFLLGFVAGAALVGVPVAFLVDWPWWVTGAIVVIAGLAGAVYGDRFLNAVADSKWWRE